MGKDREDSLVDLDEVESQLSFISEEDCSHGEEVETCEEPNLDAIEVNYKLQPPSQSLEIETYIHQKVDVEENQQIEDLSIEDLDTQAFYRLSTFLSTYGSSLEGPFSSEDMKMIGLDETEREEEEEELDRAFAAYLLPDQLERVSSLGDGLYEHIADMKRGEEKGERYDDSGYESISFDLFPNPGLNSDHIPSFLSPSPDAAEQSSTSHLVVPSTSKTKADVTLDKKFIPKRTSNDILRQVLQREHDNAHPDFGRHQRQATYSPRLLISPSFRLNDDYNLEGKSIDEGVKQALTLSPRPSKPIFATNPLDIPSKHLSTPMENSCFDKPWFLLNQSPSFRSESTRNIHPLPERAQSNLWLSPRLFKQDSQDSSAHGPWSRLTKTKEVRRNGKQRGVNKPFLNVNMEEPTVDRQEQPTSRTTASEPNSMTMMTMSTNDDVSLEMSIGVDEHRDVAVGMHKTRTVYQGDPVMFSTLNIHGERFPWGWEY